MEGGRHEKTGVETDLSSWSEKEVDDCLSTIGVHAGQTVLDFGCATGTYSMAAARIVGEQGKVYAIDKNEDALNKLQRSASDEGLGRIKTISTDGEPRIPLQDEAVDTVFLHDVLHLIGWEESGGRTMRRSTAADRKALLEEVYRAMRDDGLLSVFAPHLATHTDIVSVDELNREIEEAGFRLEKEVSCHLLHDGSPEKGVLHSFRKRKTNEPPPEAFVYDSPQFQEKLKQNAHHHGEVTMIQAMAAPDMIALELGANRGVTTVALAKCVGPQGVVHSFEPVPDYHAALIDNLKRNRVQNVRAHQVAVTGDENRINYYKHGEGSGIVQTDDAECITVESISLDGFVAAENLERVDFINMDCEGAELFVFQGGVKALEQYMPLIFCEIHHDYLSKLGQSVNDIEQYLRSLGYEVKPVQVEALDDEVDLAACSHICAVAEDFSDTVR